MTSDEKSMVLPDGRFYCAKTGWLWQSRDPNMTSKQMHDQKNGEGCVEYQENV